MERVNSTERIWYEVPNTYRAYKISKHNGKVEVIGPKGTILKTKGNIKVRFHDANTSYTKSMSRYSLWDYTVKFALYKERLMKMDQEKLVSRYIENIAMFDIDSFKTDDYSKFLENRITYFNQEVEELFKLIHTDKHDDLDEDIYDRICSISECLDCEDGYSDDQYRMRLKEIIRRSK